MKLPVLGLALVLALRLGAEPVSPTAEAVTDIDGLKAKIEDMQRAWRIEGYTQLRYDDQQYKITGISAPNSGQDIVGSAGTAQVGVRGAYIKKFEIKTSGEILKNLKWVAGFDFAEGKVKDLGTEWSGLPMVPFALPDWTWTLKVGQFRQPFGIEPQTGTPGLAFHERSLINGGASPLSPPASTINSLQLIGERVLGIQAVHRQEHEGCGYEGGLALSNDGTDQVKGSNSLAGGFPSQLNDESPTFTARLALFCNRGANHKLGVSYQRNSKDTAFMAGSPAAQLFDETLGLDWRGEIPKKSFVQAEWIGQNAQSGATGVFKRREGWYAEGGLNVLGFIAPAAKDKLEILGRYEKVNTDVNNAVYSPTIGAATLGLKWTYGKNSQSSLNYSAYSVDDNFGAAGNVSLFSLQEVVTF